MKVTPITTLTRKPVAFGEGNLNNITPRVGLLSIQNADSLNFEKNMQLTQKADAVQNNPIKAFFCKLTKAYNILFSNKNELKYIHIPYMA